ncbi:nucleoside deaminase, partial [Modestobacter roseus]|uniref:nucleoside deaminase n=1 Tax=Modestobacter roseus TaxID=1181884 RepID=UPI001E4133C1
DDPPRIAVLIHGGLIIAVHGGLEQRPCSPVQHPAAPLSEEALDVTTPPVPLDESTARTWLAVALAEARAGGASGGVPIGAALVAADGTVLGRGHNRRVQDGDPSAHAETAAFRAAGRQRSYRGTTMVTTLSPCWYCTGLVRQFGISRLVVGETRTFTGGHEWLAEHGVEVVVLDDPDCTDLMTRFATEQPGLWLEDIGSDDDAAAVSR